MLNTPKLPQNRSRSTSSAARARSSACRPARPSPRACPSRSRCSSRRGRSNKEVLRKLDPGFRAMAVQVDQVTGVGTIIQPGDRVDVIISFEDTDGKFPVIFEGAPTTMQARRTTVRTFENFDDKLNNTSVKVLVQDSKVLGTLLPPPPPSELERGHAGPDDRDRRGRAQRPAADRHPAADAAAGRAGALRPAGRQPVARPAGRRRIVTCRPSPPPASPSSSSSGRWGVLPGQMTLQAPPPPARPRKAPASTVTAIVMAPVGPVQRAGSTGPWRPLIHHNPGT